MSDSLEKARKHVMPFGKNKGKALRWIENNDLMYLDWLTSLDNLREPLLSFVEDLCRENENEICQKIDARDEAIQGDSDCEWDWRDET